MKNSVQTNLRLSAQRALLGAVPTSLRAFSVDILGSTIRARSIFDSAGTPEHREMLSVACAEIISDFAAPFTMQDEHLDVPFGSSMQHLAHLIFLRHESLQRGPSVPLAVIEPTNREATGALISTVNCHGGVRMRVGDMEYKFTMGSDIGRDGMYVEATVENTPPQRTVAEIFYSDATENLFLSCFEEHVPLELIEQLIEDGKRSLPPVKRG